MEKYRNKHKGITESSLTLLQYFSEILVVAGAVPSAVPELVLALPHAQPGPFSHLSDDLRLSLAQFGLFPSQALRLPANGVGVHHQRTAHRPGKVEMGTSEERTNASEERREKVGFCLLSNACSFTSVNSVAEVINSHRPRSLSLLLAGLPTLPSAPQF